MHERKEVTIIKRKGSTFRVKNSSVWEGFTGEILSIEDKTVFGEMSNGEIGRWLKTNIEILDNPSEEKITYTRLTDWENLSGQLVKDVQFVYEGKLLRFENNTYVVLSVDRGHVDGDDSVSLSGTLANEEKLQLKMITQEEFNRLNQERDSRRQKNIDDRERREYNRLKEKFE